MGDDGEGFGILLLLFLVGGMFIFGLFIYPDPSFPTSPQNVWRNVTDPAYHEGWYWERAGTRAEADARGLVIDGQHYTADGFYISQATKDTSLPLHWLVVLGVLVYAILEVILCITKYGQLTYWKFVGWNVLIMLGALVATGILNFLQVTARWLFRSFWTLMTGFWQGLQELTRLIWQGLVEVAPVLILVIGIVGGFLLWKLVLYQIIKKRED